MTKVAIIGSGSHTRSSINLLLNTFDAEDISIYDDSFDESAREIINSIPLVGTIGETKLDQLLFLSIGDNSLRKKYFTKYKNQLLKDNIFHHTSFQEKDVVFGIANQIFANSYVNSQVIIGSNNIINTAAIIEHDVRVGNHNHISVGAKICGKSIIGNMCLIGAGSVI